MVLLSWIAHWSNGNSRIEYDVGNIDLVYEWQWLWRLVCLIYTNCSCCYLWHHIVLWFNLQKENCYSCLSYNFVHVYYVLWNFRSCTSHIISSNRNNDWSHIFNCWLLKVFLFLLHFKFSQNFAMIYVSAKDNLTYILAFLLIHGHGMKLNCFHKNYQIDTVSFIIL